MLIDSHCHLDGHAFDNDRDEVLASARAAGVGHFLAIGTGEGPPDLSAAVRLAEAYEDVSATVGVHPHDARKFTPTTAKELERLCAQPKVLAVGEIGLDYHYDNSPREAQQRVFIEQMKLAAGQKKPIIIHTREAWDDTLRLLAAHWAPTGLGGVMHCFSGGSEQALQCLNMGFYLSFAGILTFGRSGDLRATARFAPPDRVLVETDSPYLTPAPYRKIRRNEPRFVVETAKKLAEVTGKSFEEIAERTTRNFETLFAAAMPLTYARDSEAGISAT